MAEIIVAVDTQIVMIGCRMAGRAETEACYLDLLGAFHAKTLLALDKHTRQEYHENMGPQSEGRAWLTQLALKDRIQFYDNVPTEKRKTKVALDGLGFSKKDLRFVRLALAINSRVLVAEEPHFRNVGPLLKKHEGIHVHNAKSACALIDANQQDNSPV